MKQVTLALTHGAANCSSGRSIGPCYHNPRKPNRHGLHVLGGINRRRCWSNRVCCPDSLGRDPSKHTCALTCDWSASHNNEPTQKKADLGRRTTRSTKGCAAWRFWWDGITAKHSCANSELPQPLFVTEHGHTSAPAPPTDSTLTKGPPGICESTAYALRPARRKPHEQPC